MKQSALAGKIIALLIFIISFGNFALAKETTLSAADRKSAEAVAEKIAESIYEMDYMDSDLSPELVSQAITQAMQDVDFNPATRAYLGQILNSWFATLPNVSGAIAIALPEISNEDKLVKGKKLAVIGSTASVIVKRKSFFISTPPYLGSRTNSDYQYK